jgi:hypothetical protein
VDAVDRVVLDVQGDGEAGDLDLRQRQLDAVERRLAVRLLAALQRQLDADLDGDAATSGAG